MWKISVCLLLAILATGCSTLRDSPKTEFKDGYYTKKHNGKSRQVYVNINDDNIVVYRTTKTPENVVAIDTTASPNNYKTESNGKTNQSMSFMKNSFDLDFITIPLKFRVPQKGVPGQLNANLNGAVYIGYRSDNYKLRYTITPLKKSVRSTEHYGFSYGFFSGLGNTAMNATNTNMNIVQEYDGIVWSKGIAGIIAVDNFTVGITLGFDNLLDKNSKYWIYENKPWAGLAFGLNLN